VSSSRCIFKSGFNSVGLGALAFAFSLLFFAKPALATSTGDSFGDVSSDSEGSATQKTVKDLSLMGLWTTMSGLQSRSDTNYSAETDFNLLGSYKLSSDYSLTGNFGLRKELSQQQRLLGQDGLVGVTHSAFVINPYMKFTPSMGVRIPISEQSSDYDSMYGGVQASGRIDFAGAAVGIKRASFTYIGTVGRDFYQYNQALSGGIIGAPNAPAPAGSVGAPVSGGTSPDQINIEYDFRNVALLNYQFTDALSFTETGIYVAGYDFDDVVHGNFQFTEEVDYQLAKQVTVGLGFSNGGNMLGPDGQSSNVEIYNPNSASVYGSLILTY
jgi:hypothetical protein